MVLNLNDYIKTQAEANGVNYSHFYATLNCESEGFRDVAMQSRIPNASGPNGYEDSWGVAQIHLPDHPDITRAEAQDPIFAISWAAKEFAAGRATEWTEYRKEVADGWTHC